MNYKNIGFILKSKQVNIILIILFFLSLIYLLKLYHSPYSVNDIVNWEYNDKRIYFFCYLFTIGFFILIYSDFKSKKKNLVIKKEINFKILNIIIPITLTFFIILKAFTDINLFTNTLEVHQNFHLGAIQSLFIGKGVYTDVSYQYGPGLLMLNSFFTELFGMSIYAFRITYIFLNFIFILILFTFISQILGNKVLLIFFLGLELIINYSSFVFSIFNFYQGRWVLQIILVISYLFLFRLNKFENKLIFILIHGFFSGLSSWIFNEILGSYLLAILIFFGIIFMLRQISLRDTIILSFSTVVVTILFLIISFFVFTKSYDVNIFFENYFRGSELLIYGVSNIYWTVFGSQNQNLHYSFIFYSFIPFMLFLFFKSIKPLKDTINFEVLCMVSLYSLSISMFFIVLFRSEVNHLQPNIIAFILFISFYIANFKKLPSIHKHQKSIFIVILIYLIFFNPNFKNSMLLNFYKYQNNIDNIILNFNHIMKKDKESYKNIYYQRLGHLIYNDEESKSIHKKWSNIFEKMDSEIENKSVSISTDKFPITINDHKWHVTHSFFHFFINTLPHHRIVEPAFNIWTKKERELHDTLSLDSDCLIFQNLDDPLYHAFYSDDSILKTYNLKILEKEIDIHLICN